MLCGVTEAWTAGSFDGAGTYDATYCAPRSDGGHKKSDPECAAKPTERGATWTAGSFNAVTAMRTPTRTAPPCADGEYQKSDT